MLRKLLAVLSFCGAMTGCSAPQPNPHDALRAHCEARWSAWCRQTQRCGLRTATDDCAVVPPSLDCTEPLEHARLDAGVVVFNAVAATACLRAVTQRACDANLSKPLSECTGVLAVVGGAPGARCGLCDEGAVCERSLATPDPCGTCVARQAFRYPQLGEPCFSPIVDGPGCDDGLFCGETCQPLGDLGAACDAGTCRLGLRCSAGVCAPFAEVGEACTDTLECKGGLWCSGGQCARNGEPGASCGVGDGGGTCTRSPGEGSPCDGVCSAADLRCLGSTCVKAKAQGEACGTAEECVSFWCVEGRCFDPALDCR